MNYAYTSRLLILVIAGAFFFAACGITGGQLGLQWGGATKGSPRVEGVGTNSPPPHAPAHGYRAKYQYRYYPSCSVYYDTGRKIYFYLNGENWQVSASLPSHLSVQLGSGVSIEMDTERPYVDYEAHKAKYPPGQKKKKRGKWASKK